MTRSLASLYCGPSDNFCHLGNNKKYWW